MIASGIVYGALFAFIASSEQIFREIFGKEHTFAFWFSAIALALSCGTFSNSKIVETYGMRRISHTALIVFILLSLMNYMLTLAIGPTLIIFFPLFAVTFACFGMFGTNFSALAMEPLGKISGTGSAAYGFATTTFASVFGWIVASQYDGRLNGVLLGYAALGALSLTVVIITEKGKLFRLTPDR